MGMMVLIGVISLVAMIVVGMLFYSLNKEANSSDDTVKPIADLKDFKTAVETPNPEPIRPDFAHQIAQQSAQDKVYALQQELTQISEKALSQSHEAQSMIEDLSKANEQLKAENEQLIKAYETKFSDEQQRVQALSIENQQMQVRLQESEVSVKELQEQMLALQQQSAIEMKNAKDTIERTESEIASMRIKMANVQPDIDYKKEIDELSAQKAQLSQDNDFLRQTKLEISQKIEAMEWELTQARAQVQGLERICVNYKEIIESLNASTQGARS